MAEAEKETVVTEKVVAEAEELPKAIVRRLVKDKLSQLSSDSEISVFREALEAFSDSARIFIHYLSATANDICKESKRQTINAEDVFKALEEIEFSEYVGPLRASLEDFRKKNGGKRSLSSKTKETNKKAKKKDLPSGSETQNKDDENESNKEDNAD
ncbi:DNA polymerase epsilon subunit 3 isoform X1 [Olea europaea var. sylvestris]|uniref:DNA polymerase epsilon subunit 3 isoform X1 n=1 Tax=Olea europaea var. sylvestris TaxID=158386 RepID=UPI000C1CFCE3|nr:DNA polymerase epsilon subunit 3 isoform X1 [Olea europaea var. sylvestris]